jgi:ferredoxin-NADP reductase
VIYQKELSDIAQSDPRFVLQITLTRDSAEGWSGAVGRIGLSMVQQHLERLGGVADTFVCGYTGFVETASTLLLQAGQPGETIRTERFGPTGPSSH